MSVLSSILGGLLGSAGVPGTSPAGSVLSGALGGDAGRQPVPGSEPTDAGGEIGDILSKFRQAGLGHVADSWVSNGPNHPVSPDDVGRALGEDRTREMASQAGMDHGGFLSQLAQHLPSAVDRMTPNGRVPGRDDDEGQVSV